MTSLPAKASDEIRQLIIEALGDSRRRFIDNNGSSRGYLNIWGLNANGLYQELLEGLETSDRLFFKPLKDGKEQAYQCVLAWPEDGDDYPAIEVHVTLAPKGKPPKVRVAVHPSDTAQTLPTLRRMPKNLN